MCSICFYSIWPYVVGDNVPFRINSRCAKDDERKMVNSLVRNYVKKHYVLCLSIAGMVNIALAYVVGCMFLPDSNSAVMAAAGMGVFVGYVLTRLEFHILQGG